MRTFKNLTVFIIVILVSILACKKEEATPTPTPTPTVNPTNQFFSDNLTEAIQSHTVDVSSWTTITGNKGTVIWLNYGSFVDGDGNAVHGFIDIELIEALDNKDMLMLNRPTVTNNGELLISGGIIYINATQNGEQLQIGDPISTTMPTGGGGSTSSPFSIWNGDTTTNGDFVWTENTTNTSLIDTTTWTDSFNFNLDTLGWSNIDKLAYLGQGSTDSVSVVLPSGLNGDNSAVMMYFTSINSIMQLYDAGASSNKDGIFNNGGIPIGADLKFVVLSMVDDVWSYHVSPNISITDPTNYIVPSLTSAADEESAETAILNAL